MIASEVFKYFSKSEKNQKKKNQHKTELWNKSKGGIVLIYMI